MLNVFLINDNKLLCIKIPRIFMHYKLYNFASNVFKICIFFIHKINLLNALLYKIYFVLFILKKNNINMNLASCIFVNIIYIIWLIYSDGNIFR
jgi:hypothetical protein